MTEEERIKAIWEYTDWIRSMTDSIIVVPNNSVYKEFLIQYKGKNIFLKGTEPKTKKANQ